MESKIEMDRTGKRTEPSRTGIAGAGRWWRWMGECRVSWSLRRGWHGPCPSLTSHVTAVTQPRSS
ncbi:hypothetical protein E2C01_005893 [Portunus trituberculatus]|uniref:Uncharacterized protein n=1 Tax=Portunus trituberculatus TaxID=210409 RepID=A0A5B7CWF0_PORTR|nr:hypothetical protein [Portunus trituberculatus]